jgi:hypothetical protein
MRSFRSVVWSALAIAGVAASAAHAQTTAGSGTVIVLPLAAHIALEGSYATTVFVRNPNANDITIDVRYYQSDSANPAGTGTPLSCGQLAIPANRAVTFDLGSQCTFTGQDNFGQIVLEDATSAYKTNVFYAYSRTQVPNGNGFSVEGFPVGNFSAAPGNAPAEAIGLKRTVAAPHYRSNCFVGALGEPVDYTIRLFQGETGAPIGNQITGSLGAYHSIRHLDVFVAAGAADADYQNVRATFTSTTNSALIGYCTMETSDNGSADFRIAKSMNARDNRQSRLACYGMDDCTSDHSSAGDPGTILDITRKNIHYLIIAQPDFVKCDLVSGSGAGDRLADLQIVLRQPGDPLTAAQFTPSPPYDTGVYTSGGTGQTGFYIYTGEKGAVNSGTTTRWYIDVSYRAGGVPTTPIDYGIKCRSGNGLTVPWLGATAPADP